MTPKEEYKARVAGELHALADLVGGKSRALDVFTSLKLVRSSLTRFETLLREELGLGHIAVCLHCGEPYGQDYMVHDHVWKAAVPDAGARYEAARVGGLPRPFLLLHLRCLEDRIGRRVEVTDLKPVPSNDAIRYFLNRKEERT